MASLLRRRAVVVSAGHRRGKSAGRSGRDRMSRLGDGLGLAAALGGLLLVGQHPPQLGISPPMLLEQLPARLDDAPPRQGPLHLHLAGRAIPVLARFEVLGEHGDPGRRRDVLARGVFVKEVVAVAGCLAKRPVLLGEKKSKGEK
jgi:hypothetical protein